MAAKDRHISPYSLREKVARLLWAIVQSTLFKYSFHTWNRYRILLVNLFGGSVKYSCVIRRTAKIECPWNLIAGDNVCIGDYAIVYCLGKIMIGDRVSISQYAHLCAGTHDYADESMPLKRLPITICEDVWIAADSFVGPGVTIGEGVVLGARGVAVKNLDSNGIYAGNPAQLVKKRSDRN